MKIYKVHCEACGCGTEFTIHADPVAVTDDYRRRLFNQLSKRAWLKLEVEAGCLHRPQPYRAGEAQAA